MKVLVLIKEVPVVSDIHIDRNTLTVDRSGAGKMMNVSDRNAIEAALCVAEATGGSVTAMSMGPESCEEHLRTAIGMGALEAFRITDNKFAGADTLVTARVLKAAADKCGPFDCIITGDASIDGETGQIPGKLAAMLGYALLTKASNLEVSAEGISIERKAGSGYEKLSASYPLVCSVCDDANTPRSVGLKGRTAMKKAEIPVYDSEGLSLGGEELVSLSKVTGLVPPAAAQVGTMLTGADDIESAGNLVNTLLEKNYL